MPSLSHTQEQIKSWLHRDRHEEPPLEAAEPEAGWHAAGGLEPPLPGWVRSMEQALADTTPPSEALAAVIGAAHVAAPEPSPRAEPAAGPAPDLAHEAEPAPGPELAAGPPSEAGPPPPAWAAAPTPDRVAQLSAQLAARPHSHWARVELARRCAQAGDWDAAIAHYEELIAAHKFLPAAVCDLEAMLLQDGADPVEVYRLLGNAYTELGQADRGVEMYRVARETLRALKKR